MKKFSTKIIYAFIGTLILSLSGCIDVKQDIWINKDGSGKFIFDVGISKQMKAMMEGFGGLEGLGGEEEDGGGNEIPFSAFLAAIVALLDCDLIESPTEAPAGSFP